MQTETTGGAIAGGVKGSIAAATNIGTIGGDWTELPAQETTLGDLHNEGLARVYKRFQFNQRELSPQTWQRIDRAILTFVWEKEFYTPEIDTYLRGMDPTFESIMKRIQEATTNNPSFPVSSNFYPNLVKALALLESNQSNPEDMVEAFIQMVLDSALVESDTSLVRAAQGMDFGKIEVTYNPQKNVEGNNDIILAQLIANFTRKSYDYWKAQSAKLDDTMDIIIVVPGRAKLGEPKIVEEQTPERIRGLKVVIGRLDAKVGIDPVQLDVAPFIEHGRTMVPFRFVGESLGAAIGWNPENFNVSYLLGENTLILYIGKNIALLNGKEIAIDENPSIVARIINGRTVVPLRFISESLGFKVTWNPEKQSVGIQSNPYFVNNSLSGEMTD